MKIEACIKYINMMADLRAEKEKGIEPFYCASEDMFEKSIFATKEEAEQKLAEIKGE